jgi:hypothetical protein
MRPSQSYCIGAHRRKRLRVFGLHVFDFWTRASVRDENWAGWPARLWSLLFPFHNGMEAMTTDSLANDGADCAIFMNLDIIGTPSRAGWTETDGRAAIWGDALSLGSASAAVRTRCLKPSMRSCMGYFGNRLLRNKLTMTITKASYDASLTYAIIKYLSTFRALGKELISQSNAMQPKW